MTDQKSKINKYIIWALNIFCGIFFLLLSFLMSDGAISSGTGLGDYFYFIFIVGYTILHFIFLFIFKNQTAHAVLSIVSLIILAYFIYSVTLGRGAVHQWDGHVFI